MRLFFSLSICVFLMACSNPYKGPKTDHFNGKVFLATEHMSEKSFWDVLKWRMTAERAKWPEWIEVTPSIPPAKVDGKELRVTFVNHSTVLVQTDGLNILTDPIWSKRASPFSFMGPKRVHAPGIAFENLPKIDIVLISHSHYDHLDLATVKKLQERDQPVFVVPLGVDRLIKTAVKDARVQVMDWNQDFAFNDRLKITAEPVQHWSARSLWDRNYTLWTGFVLDFPDGKIYYTGDTGYFTGKVFKNTFAKHGKMRFAIIPIGAYEPRWFMKESHVNPNESVNIFQDVHAEHAIGVHYGTFQLTDEAIDAPVKDLSTALKKVGIPSEKFRALKPGEFWVVD